MKKGTVKLTGGEPIIHPRFFELAEQVIRHGHKLEIGTNFSMPNCYFEKLVDLIEEDRESRLLIIASLHISQIDSVDWFIQKAAALRDYAGLKLQFDILTVLTNENFEILKNAYAQFKNENFLLQFKRLKVNGQFITYQNTIETYLRQTLSGEELRALQEGEILKDWESFGTPCKTGFASLNIYEDGRVQRCYTPHDHLFQLGNINDTVRVFKKVMPCPCKRCTCYLPVRWNMICFEKKIEFTP
jgi:organic radical activating enzyme